jgi:predicted LPLAT superfamily acyltransferase
VQLAEQGRGLGFEVLDGDTHGGPRQAGSGLTMATRPDETDPAHWSAARERSNRFALKLMAFIAVHLGRPVARLVLHPITWYFLLFSPGPKRQTRRYLRRALGREPGWMTTTARCTPLRRWCWTACTWHAGAWRLFDLHVRRRPGAPDCWPKARRLLLGAHIGSFEALHAVGKGQQLPVAMVMFPDNARMIHSVLQAVAPDMALEIIAIGRPGSTLAIRDWLDRGGLVGVLGDRVLPGGAARAGARSDNVSLPFLGVPAPFSTTARCAWPCCCAGGHLHGRPVPAAANATTCASRPWPTSPSRPSDPAERERLMRAALLDYVARLEALCREAPYNWFNFYDYWRELRASGVLSFVAPDRFTRQTLEPLAESMTVEGNTITLKRNGRSRQMAMDAVPELAALISAVRGTLTGDAATLEKHFQVRVEGTAARWMLTLVPRDARLATQVRELQIAGLAGDVRSVALWLGGGRPLGDGGGAATAHAAIAASLRCSPLKQPGQALTEG